MGVFKAYDIRGVYNEELNEELAYRIGRNLPALIGGTRVLVGRDARLSSPSLVHALEEGLLDAGCNVDDVGYSSTPMIYFFTAEFDYDISIQVTASHNPANYNGFKISRKGALPVGYDTGLAELEKACQRECPKPTSAKGTLSQKDYLPAFLSFLEKFIPDLNGLRIVVDCSDGMGALTAKALFSKCDATFIAASPDGSFPNHPPNPLEPAGRELITKTVLEQKADLGIIFDGDADRVMFIDEKGEFVRPDLMIAPMAAYFLSKYPNSPILHDIRTSRGVTEALEEMGAKPYIWKVGHAFAKVKLREINGPFGGEYAGHYYFRDFHWCDSGELASLIALGEIAKAKKNGQTFSQFIAPINKYANSGEVNFKIEDKDGAIDKVISALKKEEAPLRELDFDGIRLDYKDWWISLRKSNTEPYLRLLLEAASEALLNERLTKVKELLGQN